MKNLKNRLLAETTEGLPAGRPAARRWAASHMRLSRSPQKSLTKMRLSRSPQTDKSHKNEII